MYFFIDIESTGFDPWRHSMIEIGCLYVDKDFNVLREFETRIRPEPAEQWTEQAERIHGITLDSLESAPCLDDSLRDIYNHCSLIFGQSRNATFVDHSRGKFDWRWLFASSAKVGLEFEFRKYFHVDRYESSMDLAKNLAPDGLSTSLDALCEHYGIELSHHNALSDVHGCFEIYKRLRMVSSVVIPITSAGLEWSLDKRVNHKHGKAYKNDGKESLDPTSIDNTRLGYIGEWAFLQHYPSAKHINGDYDFILNGKKVEVKCSRQKKYAYLQKKDMHRETDFYFFVYFNESRMSCEFVGYASAKEVDDWQESKGPYGDGYKCHESQLKKIRSIGL
jgi:DNA polymerase III epsilon subunit-like protein